MADKALEQITETLRKVEALTKLGIVVSPDVPKDRIYLTNPQALGTLNDALVDGGAPLLKTVICGDEATAEKVRSAARQCGLIVVDTGPDKEEG